MIDISVVIPSFNRRESLYALVSALMAQHDPGIATEIIVVLDGSTDDSAKALASLTPPPNMRFLVHAQLNRGLAAARNAGLKLASGEIVLFLDDDVIPSKQLVKSYLDAFQVTTADVVLGRIHARVTEELPPAIAEKETSWFETRHTLLVDGVVVNALDVCGGNMAAKRSCLLNVGGFDESFREYGCEDTDLGQQLLDAGATFAYASDAAIIHCYHGTIHQWRRRGWWRGRAEVKLLAKHPNLTPYLAFHTLYDADQKRRSAAQFAIQFPRVAYAASTTLLWLMSIAQGLGKSSLSLKLASLSWLMAFWSGARSMFSSAQAVRAYYRSVTDDSATSESDPNNGKASSND